MLKFQDTEPAQTLAIWDWTSETETPMISVIIDGPPQVQGMR